MNLLSKAWRPAWLWALAVLIACGFPGHALPHITFWQWLRWDKLIHLFLFGIQSYFLLLGYLRQYELPPGRKAMLAIILITALYGALLEVMQATLFIGRSGDARDALANALGAILGLLVFRKLHR